MPNLICVTAPIHHSLVRSLPLMLSLSFHYPCSAPPRRAAIGSRQPSACSPASSTSSGVLPHSLPCLELTEALALTPHRPHVWRRTQPASSPSPNRGGYRASSARLDRARAGSLRERAGSARLVKQPSQRTSSARLVCELELARLAREPQQKIVYMGIYNDIINC
jgi:hypothetical protein